MDAGHPRPSYQHHAGFYRGVMPGDELQPWEWSPVTDHSLPKSPMKPIFEISKAHPLGLSGPIPSPAITLVRVPVDATKNKGLWAAIRRFLRFSSISQSSVDQVVTMPAQGWTLDRGISPVSKVQPCEWKQYGYWARPFLNNVECVNSPVGSERSVTSDALKDIILSLRGPEPYEKHPELWVPGIKHRCLPPRSTRWTVPVPGEPLPFPWEVQINPLLQHMIWGPSPLSWYIGVDPDSNLSYGRTRFEIPCAQADRAQPATWPFLTHMRFNAVAGDSAPKFPWPFTVCNPRGLKCGDVLSGIYAEFHKPVTRDEKMSWPPLRQKAAQDALELRCRLQGFDEVQDEMRRYDSLGGVMWFRGIEPTIDGEGWMITLGTH